MMTFLYHYMNVFLVLLAIGGILVIIGYWLDKGRGK